MTARSRHPWTDEDHATVARLYPDANTERLAAHLGRSPRSIYQQAEAMGLKKSPEYFSGGGGSRWLPGDPRSLLVGGATRFAKGHKSWNKGMKGLDIGGKATRFRKGNKPQTTLPVGDYRLNPDGHLQRKIGEASGNNSKRWRCVAELVWVEANGPLPAGCIVVFKPGQFTAVLEQITLDRVECVTRAENLRRNSAHRHGPEMSKLYQLKGAITRQVNRINKEAQEAKEQHAP